MAIKNISCFCSGLYSWAQKNPVTAASLVLSSVAAVAAAVWIASRRPPSEITGDNQRKSLKPLPAPGVTDKNLSSGPSVTPLQNRAFLCAPHAWFPTILNVEVTEDYQAGQKLDNLNMESTKFTSMSIFFSNRMQIGQGGNPLTGVLTGRGLNGFKKNITFIQLKFEYQSNIKVELNPTDFEGFSTLKRIFWDFDDRDNVNSDSLLNSQVKKWSVEHDLSEKRINLICS